MSRSWNAWLALALVALTFAVYWPGRHGGYVLDDQQNLQANQELHAIRGFDAGAIATATMATPPSGIWRQLSIFTFALNFAATGDDPAAMKLTNAGIHAANGLLAWWLVSLVLALPVFAGLSGLRRRWAAVFGAWAWTLHPLQATAVLYVVQRMESLSHLFVFAGLIAYLKLRDRRPLMAFAATLLFAAIGCLAKESAALLPLYALALEALIVRRTPRALAIAYAALLGAGAVVAFGWLLPNIAAGYSTRSFTLVERLLTEPRVLFDYLRWSVLPLPTSLGLFHDDIALSRGLLQPPTTLLSLVGIGVLPCLSWALRRTRPLMALGIAWWLAAHLLTATFIPLELAYEHRNYFALLGVVLVLADALLLMPTSPATMRFGALLSAFAVLCFAGITMLRAWEWRTPETFALSEAAKHPGSARAQFEKARMLVRLTRYRGDSPLLGEAWASLERARETPGSDAMPDQAAIVLATLTGQPARANAWWDDLDARLRRQPLSTQDINAVVVLGNCAADGLCDFPPRQMSRIYDAALSHRVDATVLESYGKYALHVLGDQQLALQAWRDATNLAPRDRQMRYNLARLYLVMGNAAEARKQRDLLAQQGIASRVLVADLDAHIGEARE